MSRKEKKKRETLHQKLIYTHTKAATEQAMKICSNESYPKPQRLQTETNETMFLFCNSSEVSNLPIESLQPKVGLPPLVLLNLSSPSTKSTVKRPDYSSDQNHLS
ncbi:hypothetical protein Hanom_Chr17g01542561 [Helianthus anomalus]